MTLQSEKLEIEVPVVVAETPAAAAERTEPGTMQMLSPVTVDSRPVAPNALSRADGQHAVGNLKGLGRSLFGDYLFAVELAGTLLLIASIGAIAIAPRREQGAL